MLKKNLIARGMSRLTFLLLLMLCFWLCAKPGQASQLKVFSTDFDSGLPAQFSGAGGIEGVQGFAGLGHPGYQFSGNFLRNTSGGNPAAPSILTLTNLPAHTSVNIGFLLAAIDSWDSTNGASSPDYFNVSVDSRLVFQTTFNNASGSVTYSGDDIGGGLQQRGFSIGSFYNDRAFDMNSEPALQNIPHTASTLTIRWFASGAGWQGGGDESWGIDNVRIFLNGTQTGLSLGIGDQRTWVGNTSEFTVNIKNTGITPQPLTSVAITGTPWATLLSALPTAPLQPGEQIQLTYRLAVPGNATGGGANSPVIIPVSLDVFSGTTKFSEPFQIQLYQVPATQIVAHVQDDVTTQPIANALVALDNTSTLYQTDNNGNVTLTVTPGARTVFAYATSHLPDQQTVILNNGALAPVTLSLKQGQALAVSSVVATPLTLAQVQARGINLSDPSNFFIYDFVVRLRIGDATVPNVIIPAHPEPGSTIVGNFSSGGGTGGYYSFYFPTGDPTVRVETWIVIEGDIRVLKQFWDATVFINNNTSLPINNLDAMLTVPTGLSLPPLFGQPQPLTQTLGTIPALSVRQAEWTVRGDVAGMYQLTGTATGSLSLGGSGVPLSSTLRSNPITVVAPRLSVAFQTPDAVAAGQNFLLGMDITNDSAIDLQLVQVNIKTDRLVNCVLAPGQASLVSLGSIAMGQTKHVDFTFTSLVTGKVLEVQTYVSPNPEISPDVTVNAAKVKGVDDIAVTSANTSVNIPVLTNDVGDTTLAVSTVTQGAHGSVTTNGLQAFYVPAPGFIGVDYFSYVAQDTQGNTGTANVTVTVNSVSPTISSPNPASALVGSSGFDLTVNGSGFDLTTQATWNGAARVVTFVSPSQIKVTLLASDLSAAGLGALMIRNPSAGSALTSYAVYNRNNGDPLLSASIGRPSRNAAGNIVIPISIANTGQSDALNVILSAATLRAGGGLLNVTPASSLGGSATVFIGTTQQFLLVFPGNAGASGTPSVLQFSFAPSGGSPQGRSQRLTLP